MGTPHISHGRKHPKMYPLPHKKYTHLMQGYLTFRIDLETHTHKQEPMVVRFQPSGEHAALLA